MCGVGSVVGRGGWCVPEESVLDEFVVRVNQVQQRIRIHLQTTSA